MGQRGMGLLQVPILKRARPKFSPPNETKLSYIVRLTPLLKLKTFERVPKKFLLPIFLPLP